MTDGNEPTPLDTTLRLPDGSELAGGNPVVLIGANGSGKTRKARDLSASCSIEFINALRNTRIQPSLPAMSYVDAERNFDAARNRSRQTHWDWTEEFEFLLASLLAEHATTAIKFMDAVRAGETAPDTRDTLQEIRDLWSSVFPGRQFSIEDYRPVIKSTVPGEEFEYSAQTMSDGERAAIYLAGRVLRAQPGVLVVDEPETHLHSLLAARFWDELEKSRPDVRFVYITHDLTFARSRREARYVIASPVDGLKAIDMADGVPDDVAEILLGTASLSFYARRIVLCEGGADDRDAALYGVWFNDRDTVVRPVGGSDMVRRCMSALQAGGLIANLEAIGIIDRDFHSDRYLGTLTGGLHVLPVHEVESLYCLPGVVSAVAAHLHKTFDESGYVARLKQGVSDTERHKVILERWKRRIEPRLTGVVASVHTRTDSLNTIVDALPQIFDASTWSFSPADILEEERVLIENAAEAGTVDDFLRRLPGKGLLATAANYVGQQPEDYVNLVNGLLLDVEADDSLGSAIETALAPSLPTRTVSQGQPSSPSAGNSSRSST